MSVILVTNIGARRKIGVLMTITSIQGLCMKVGSLPIGSIPRDMPQRKIGLELRKE